MDSRRAVTAIRILLRTLLDSHGVVVSNTLRPKLAGTPFLVLSLKGLSDLLALRISNVIVLRRGVFCNAAAVRACVL